jgi:hypothetical protein
MNHLSSRRCVSLATTLVIGLISSLGLAVLVSRPAAADPRVPKDVWVQCTGFSGPNTQWPHLLSGCTSRSGENGSGQTVRTSPGTETIQWNEPFLDGKSMALTNISSAPVGPSPACPSTHPVAVRVSGTIAPDQMFGGSPVTATICVNATDFVLQPGTFFTIHKDK